MHKNKMTETNKQNILTSSSRSFMLALLLSLFLFGLLFYYRDFVYNAILLLDLSSESVGKTLLISYKVIAL